MRLVLVSMNLGKGATGAAFRGLKLTKYLARAGCELDVVCADRPEGELLGPVPDRVRFLVVPFRPPAGGSSLAARAVNRLLCWPDPQAAWTGPVLRRLLPELRARRPDAVVVTTPPHVTQMIGARLAEELAIPFLADMTDDWLTNSRQRWHTPLHRWVAGRCERRMVRWASVVFLNTPAVHARFAARYPRWAGKLRTLTSGYDEDDFRTEGPPPADVPPGKKVLLYAGGGYGGWLMTVLAALARRMRELGLDARWHIVTATDAGAPPAKFAGFWTHLGFLSPRRATAAMCQADLLLLPMPPGEKSPSGTVPQKAYSYLRTAGAIVYLGEPGATTDLLEGFEGTWCLGREAWPGLAEWIAAHDAELSARWRRTGVEAYSLECLTGRLLGAARQAAAATDRLVGDGR